MKCANPRIYKPREGHIRKQFSNYMNGARRRGYDYMLDLEEFRKFYLSPCVYCGIKPAKGIDRKNNDQGYVIKNCAPCCKQCNMAKRDMTEIEFFRWLQRLTKHQEAWL